MPRPTKNQAQPVFTSRFGLSEDERKAIAKLLEIRTHLFSGRWTAYSASMSMAESMSTTSRVPHTT